MRIDIFPVGVFMCLSASVCFCVFHFRFKYNILRYIYFGTVRFCCCGCIWATEQYKGGSLLCGRGGSRMGHDSGLCKIGNLRRI